MMRLCSEPNCGRNHYGKGLCNTHYARLYRNGDANVVRKPANGTVTKWIETVAIPFEGDECLIFPFGVGNHGYGVINGELAHRVVCQRTHGDPPEGMQSAHSCGNRTCVNKRHLRWDTRQGNEADKIAHGTLTRGERHGRAKLTEADVLAIRSATGPQREICARFDIVQQTVSDIKIGRRWSWL